MPLLTKKFTRDSLRRANGGGTSAPNENEEQAKAEMIRREMARARAKSMQSRNVLNQQHRRHRSLSRGPSSSYRAREAENVRDNQNPGGSKPLRSAHPNDEYSQAFSEAELLTQMSSLTEPTWAPSVVGGSDLNSGHHRQNQQSQRSRTGNYNSIRHPKRFQHNTSAAATISTANGQKETKELPLDDNEKRTGFGHEKRNANHGHYERASAGSKGVELHRIGQDEGREEDKMVGSSTKHFSNDTEISEIRDDAPEDELLFSTPRNKLSLSSQRSRNRRQDDKSNASRTRGRSGRPNGRKKSKKRSSSLSSERSAQSTTTASTAPTNSKHSSAYSSSLSLASSRSKSGATTQTRRRKNREKDKSATPSRSSSVPPSTSNSQRSQRTTSVPPKTFRRNELGRNNRYGGGFGYNRASSNSAELEKNATDLTLNTASTMADLTTASSQSYVQSKISFATDSETSSMAPSSSIEAARMSLRPRLRRSNSNRSISSMQSESVSTTNNRKAKAAEKTIERTESRSKTEYKTRESDLTQPTQRRRHQLETKEERRQRNEEEKQQRFGARASPLEVKSNDGEPCPTTVTTVLVDFLLFCFLLLITLPQRAVLKLWSRIFSKKWTARRKNVLVMGANSALGSETAIQFATEGANLILLAHSAIPSENSLNWLVDYCRELGSEKIRCYSADPCSAVSIELTLRQAAKDFDGTFDVVILNGDSNSHGCLFEEIIDVHQIEKMVTENTLGCIMALHCSLKHIPKSSESRIAILSSTSGVIASPYRSVYVATQHALKGFCDSIRMELNDTYTERRAPKVCFASFSELVGQNIQDRENLEKRMSRMGANTAPMKTRMWAAMPLQQTVHALVGAIGSGARNFGAPRHVDTWRFLQVLAPGFVDFSIFRHSRRTQYRPECAVDVPTRRKEVMCGGASVSNNNKTWS